MQALRFALLTAGVVAATAAVAQLPVTPPNAHGVSPPPASADLCPLTIFIDAQGRLYDSRFGGRYRVTDATLRNDIGGGCKERGRTSSVRIQPSPHTNFGRVKEVLDLVQSIRSDVPVTMATPNQRH
ncbi:ExbD/TolR family protein [Terriglobus sp.]|uniref:ExbD/TolR family protein n=1 Tax=Terriglobus sp. TaxID=1889013 RepID=UPI003B002B2B